MKLPRTSKHCSVPRICTKVEVDSEVGKRCLLFYDTRYAAGWIKRASRSAKVFPGLVSVG